jgi:hypothetical protein
MPADLDIPPGIQIEPAPAGHAEFFATTKYADQYGDPLVLAEGWLAIRNCVRMCCTGDGPHLKGVIALMSAHPQL